MMVVPPVDMVCITPIVDDKLRSDSAIVLVTTTTELFSASKA